MIKLFTLSLGVISLLAQAQLPATSTCLRIQGNVIDLATKQPLATAQLVAQTAQGWVAVATSSDSGTFSGILPCETIALQVKHADYRTQHLPLHVSTTTGMRFITVQVPLIPVDKQQVDRPYLQTEQTNYVQPNSEVETQVKSSNNRIQHNTFVITDVLDKKPLPATVCFFFTQSGAKRCLKTTNAGRLEVNFSQQDIIALEVNANGYQTYDGNMILDKLDGRSLIHEIKLQRTLTVLTIDAPSASYCELRSTSRTITLTPLPGYTDQFVAYDLAPGRVELIVSYPSKQVSRTLQLLPGLNQTRIAKPSIPSLGEATRSAIPSVKPVGMELPAKPAPFQADSIPMIYFEQGSYQVRSDSQAILAQVVAYLTAHPESQLVITGHTDNVGNPQVNQTLSMYRARATATFLTKLGILDSRLIKAGMGSTQPLVPNTTETNKILNRRVSLTLIPAP